MTYLLTVVLTCAAILLAFSFRNKWLFPLLCVAAVYYPFLLETRRSALSGFFIVLLWASMLSLFILYLSFRHPERMRLLIWRSEEYCKSMFEWIQTGRLPEGGATTAVIVFHLKQAIIYCFLALISANFLSLLLGAALLNYMNYYVAQLARQSKNSRIAFFLGWNPWSIVRVLAFLWLGVGLSLPLLSRRQFSFPAMLLGIAGIILDILLKVTLSRKWAEILKRNLRQ
jgi:hypothetical protein